MKNNKRGNDSEIIESMQGEIWQLREEVRQWKSRAYSCLAEAGSRSPSQIRDEALLRFSVMAGKKFDQGQVEHGGNLDHHPDLVTAAREEIIDAWMYLESLSHQLTFKEREIARLKHRVSQLESNEKKA